jgi:hypothetical protein
MLSFQAFTTLRGKIPRMKPLLEGRTPKQLLWIMAASSALIAVGFGIAFVQSWQPHHVSFPQKLPWIAALLVGFIATMWSTAALKDGVASELWPETVLDVPRKVLKHPAILALIWSLIVASFVTIDFPRGHPIGGSWVFQALGLSLIHARGSLHPPGKVPTYPRLLLPYPTKPLLSEHWGAPPQPFSD